MTNIHPNISFDSKSGTEEERIRMLDWWPLGFHFPPGQPLLIFSATTITIFDTTTIATLVIQPLLISATTITTFDTSDTATSPTSDRAYARLHI